MEKDKGGSIKSVLGMIIGIGGYWLLTNILFETESTIYVNKCTGNWLSYRFNYYNYWNGFCV